MFFGLGHLLTTGQFQTSQPEVAIVLRDAIIESFVLHLRNLLEQHTAFLSTAQRRVMSAIELCRTAALGSVEDSGHREHRDQCLERLKSGTACL